MSAKPSGMPGDVGLGELHAIASRIQSEGRKRRVSKCFRKYRKDFIRSFILRDCGKYTLGHWSFIVFIFLVWLVHRTYNELQDLAMAHSLLLTQIEEYLPSIILVKTLIEILIES
jgi:hypothetical protein